MWRLANVMREFCIYKGYGKTLAKVLLLSKMVKQRLWFDSNAVSKQLPNIGDKLALTLASAGFTTFEKIAATDPRRLEAICGKNPPFGSTLRNNALRLPKPTTTISRDEKNFHIELDIP